MVKTWPCSTGSSGLFSDWGAKILRSHMLLAKKLEHKQQKLYCNKFNKDFKKKMGSGITKSLTYHWYTFTYYLLPKI